MDLGFSFSQDEDNFTQSFMSESDYTSFGEVFCESSGFESIFSLPLLPRHDDRDLMFSSMDCDNIYGGSCSESDMSHTNSSSFHDRVPTMGYTHSSPSFSSDSLRNETSRSGGKYCHRPSSEHTELSPNNMGNRRSTRNLRIKQERMASSSHNVPANLKHQRLSSSTQNQLDNSLSSSSSKVKYITTSTSSPNNIGFYNNEYLDKVPTTLGVNSLKIMQSTTNAIKSNNIVKPIDLIIERHPPVEVRTRTPSENRNFNVCVSITGDYKNINIHAVQVRLAYSIPNGNEVRQSILGGRKTVNIREDGKAAFDNLSMCEASTKHGEREFCLEFQAISRDGQPIQNISARTTPFYAYSHMKVLTRRKGVKLRTLSKSQGRMEGGEQMHVVGQPFIKGPSLAVIFRTPHGDEVAPNLEMYSDSVLFFESPPYPTHESSCIQKTQEIPVTVQVTNDGRTLSNALVFVYSNKNTMF